MVDMGKVAKGLKLCVVTGDFCGECPYDGMELCIEKLHDNALTLLKEQEEQIKTRDESLEKAREEIKWLRGMLKEQEAQHEYEASIEMAEYCERYEQTYNPEDGSM